MSEWTYLRSFRHFEEMKMVSKGGTSGVEEIRRRVICDVDIGVVLLRLRC